MTTVPSAGIVPKDSYLSGDVPDIINLSSKYGFSGWAKAGYFADVTGKPYLENIRMTMLKSIQSITRFIVCH